MYHKAFEEWTIYKKEIDKKAEQSVIRRCEIRWIITGVNVGSEIDGKGKMFTRPALIIDTIGCKLALVAPLSSKVKNIPGYVSFEWQETLQSLCINQIKIISTKRVLGRKGKISLKRLSYIKKKIRDFYKLDE